MKKMKVAAALAAMVMTLSIMFAAGIFTSCNRDVIDKDFLPAPTILCAEANETGGVFLSWESVDGDIIYRIYAAYDSTTESVEYLTATDSTSVTIGLNPETTVYIWVEAYDKFKRIKSDYSEVVSVTTGKFLAPKGVHAETDESGNVVLAWEYIDGVRGYKIYGSSYDSASENAVYFTTTTETAVTISELNSETTYYFWVKAYLYGEKNTYIESEYSEVVSVTTGQFYISAPSVSLVLGSETKNSVSLTWKSVDGATGYIIYISNDSVPENAEISSNVKIQNESGKITGTITNLTPKTSYYFWIKARDGHRNRISDYSNRICIVTLSEPTCLKIVNSSSHRIYPPFRFYTASDVSNDVPAGYIKTVIYDLDDSDTYDDSLGPGESYLWNTNPNTYVKITSEVFIPGVIGQYKIKSNRNIVIKDGETTTLIIRDDDFIKS